MTKDLVALSNRARSIAIIAVVVAAATLVTGPAPTRALMRSFGAFAMSEGLASRMAALRELRSRRRRRRHQQHPPSFATAVHTPEPQAPEALRPEPVAEAAANDAADRPASGLQPGAPVIGYVTAAEHAVNGDLSPTERAIEQACARAGWRLVAIVRDPEAGRILDRPGLSHALEQIADGHAAGLVVNDARLLSRSLDFAGLVNWFRDAGVPLIALDLGLDTSTPEGRRVASTLMRLNGWAGERIARRATVVEEVTLERRAGG
ncbi:MAG TPA: recombinase family protein [Solirubrobacteraceae bacterium]